MSAAIEAIGLCKHFGALQVTRDVSLSLETGARHALIGPNGAGKTTLVNLLTGALAPDLGVVRLDGRDVTQLGEAPRARAGLVRTFQINQLFRPLTVLENVTLALAETQGLAWRFWKPLGSQRELVDEALGILEQLGLVGDAANPVGQLPYGRQRLVEIALALACKPRVLLLDEPAAGVPAEDTERVMAGVNALGESLAVLLIEHDMEVVFRFADVVSVLVDGALLLTGTPDEVARDERVKQVYLGERGAKR